MTALNVAIAAGYLGMFGFCFGFGTAFFQGNTRVTKLCAVGLFVAGAGLEVVLWTAVLQ